jgi:hypothetical protein
MFRLRLSITVTGILLCAIFGPLVYTNALALTDKPSVNCSSDPKELGGIAMNSDKLDQRLIEEIRIRHEQLLTTKKAIKSIANELFNVSIELVTPLKAPTGISRQQAIKEMERQAEQIQAGVVKTLIALNVTEFERQILSNSISTQLTLDQIQTIAKIDDVKIIRLVKAEKVIF